MPGAGLARRSERRLKTTSLTPTEPHGNIRHEPAAETAKGVVPKGEEKDLTGTSTRGSRALGGATSPERAGRGGC